MTRMPQGDKPLKSFPFRLPEDDLAETKAIAQNLGATTSDVARALYRAALRRHGGRLKRPMSPPEAAYELAALEHDPPDGENSTGG